MLPSCYGLYWDGVPGSVCLGCLRQQECLDIFVSGPLAEYQKQLGAGITPEKLGELASCSAEAILLALDYQKNKGVTAPVVVQSEEIIEPIVPPSLDLEAAVVAPPSSPEELEEKVLEPEVEKAEIEPVKKKRGRKKKNAEKPVNPPATESIQSALDSVKTAEAQQQGKKIRYWDPKYNLARWERERARSSLIAQLLPGMKLTRIWKGQLTETFVHLGYYLYNGIQYPTLYSVVVAITGTKPCPKQIRKDGSRLNGSRQMTSWNAIRFFRLREIMEGKKKD